MKPRLLFLCGLTLLLSGCSFFDAINPFSSASSSKVAKLPVIESPTPVNVRWREGVGEAKGTTLSPAVVGEAVYAAGGSGTLARFDSAGGLVWKINVGQAISGGVGADQKLVVVGTVKGEILAFAAETGAPLWKAKMLSEILVPPVLGEKLVIIRSADNRITAYDALDGKRKWVYQRPIPSLVLRESSSPIIDNQFVFAGVPGGKLVALNINNGAAVWDGPVSLPKGTNELDRIADVSGAPVISGRMVCAVSYLGRVACFDLTNGNLTWSRALSSTTGLAIYNRLVYVSDDQGRVHALDLASGASLWRQEKLEGRSLTAPFVYRGFVVVGDQEGNVHFMNRDDGHFVSRITTDGSPIMAAPRSLGSQLLIQTRRGNLYGIEVE